MEHGGRFHNGLSLPYSSSTQGHGSGEREMSLGSPERVLEDVMILHSDSHIHLHSFTFRSKFGSSDVKNGIVPKNAPFSWKIDDSSKTIFVKRNPAMHHRGPEWLRFFFIKYDMR